MTIQEMHQKFVLLLDRTNTGSVPDFLPEEIRGRIFYTPSENAREREYRATLVKMWKDRYPY
jgi:hypothetical protein